MAKANSIARFLLKDWLLTPDYWVSEAELLEGLDSYTAHADELFLNVDGELAEALIDQLNELELPFIVRSHKISQEANEKWNQPFQVKAGPDGIRRSHTTYKRNYHDTIKDDGF